jgi:hypothetical protein
MSPFAKQPLFLFLAVVCGACLSMGRLTAQENTNVVDSLTKIIRLGEDTVRIKIYAKPGKNRVYLHVHENEEAALTAGKSMLEKYGGKLVTLSHSATRPFNRNIRFRYKQSVFEFDPNRIYTPSDSVLDSTIRLVKGRGKITPEIRNMVRSLADSVWNEISTFPLIVAIHNNRNTPPMAQHYWFFWYQTFAESFNITSYVMRSDYASDSNKSCEDIYINPRINNSEFFIVTQREDFMDFFSKRYNVVLQNPDPVDDGSMSVFVHSHHIRYINAEAKMGRVAEQISMLELVRE